MYFVVIYVFFRCKFYSPKILLVQKKWQISGMRARRVSQICQVTLSRSWVNISCLNLLYKHLRNIYNVNIDLCEKERVFLPNFRQIFKIIISKGTRDLTTVADSLTTHEMRKHSATTLSDETRNFIRYWDFLRLKSFETDTDTDTLKKWKESRYQEVSRRDVTLWSLVIAIELQLYYWIPNRNNIVFWFIILRIEI